MRPPHQMRPARLVAPLLLIAALAACNNNRAPADEPEPEPTAMPSSMPAQSIIRDEFEDAAALTPLATLEGRIGFPDGGEELDDAAIEELTNIAASDQLAEGWPVIIRSHTDSGGDDGANMRMSGSRGEAVAEWLIEQGVAEERITVIEFGEQNPVEPNALPDGTPNEPGRAANRRVEITIPAPGGDAAEQVRGVIEAGEAAQAERDAAAE